VMSMITAFAIMISVPYFQAFFALDLPDLKVIAQTLVVAGAAVVGLELLWRYTGSRRHRLEARGVE
jgi:hypothetical protein